MRNLKRWCAGLLLCGLVFAAAGCGKAEEPVIKQRELSKNQQEVVIEQSEEADETLGKTLEKIHKELDDYERPVFEAEPEEGEDFSEGETDAEGTDGDGIPAGDKETPDKDAAGDQEEPEDADGEETPEAAKLDEEPAEGEAPAEEIGDPVYLEPQTLEEYLALDRELMDQLDEAGENSGMEIDVKDNDIRFGYTFPEVLDDDMLAVLKPLLQLTMMEMDSEFSDLARQMEDATGLRGITVTILYKDAEGKTICKGTFGGRQ